MSQMSIPGQPVRHQHYQWYPRRKQIDCGGARTHKEPEQCAAAAHSEAASTSGERRAHRMRCHSRRARYQGTAA